MVVATFRALQNVEGTVESLVDGKQSGYFSQGCDSVVETSFFCVSNGYSSSSTSMHACIRTPPPVTFVLCERCKSYEAVSTFGNAIDHQCLPCNATNILNVETSSGQPDHPQRHPPRKTDCTTRQFCLILENCNNGGRVHFALRASVFAFFVTNIVITDVRFAKY